MDDAAAVFGRNPADALYRALWTHLMEGGYAAAILDDPEAFRRFYLGGGYPGTLVPLDPEDVGAATALRRVYGLPDGADWEAIAAAVQADDSRVVLADPVTLRAFLVLE